MENREALVTSLMDALRVKSETAKAEVEDLVDACIVDMTLKGVNVDSIEHPLIKHAIKLYCKANFGYDESTERFAEAYQHLIYSMSLSGGESK